MSESEWENRVREIKRGIGKLSETQSGRSAKIKELSKEVQGMLAAEDIEGQPEWVKRSRELRKKEREFVLEAGPTVSAIRQAIDQETGQQWGNRLHINSALGFASMSFEVWYETDEELEQDRVSGRHVELAETMKRVAREVANAPAKVGFHSSQTVREKYDGNLYRYFQ